METIGISPRFFRHELHNYSNWKQAFWRELLQNSVDEGCSRIEVQTTPEGQITFADNGPGMNETTLRDIYFQLGATGKEDADTIGGHGRARILTCFAHKSYRIRTQTLEATGSGGQYDILTGLPHQPGCIVEVSVSESSMEDMLRELHGVLETCQLPCEVTINGEKFKNWLLKRKATRKLSFGTIHTDKSRTYQTIIRVRGLAMFIRYSGCRTGTILEIEPSIARDILTASRDSLKYKPSEELDTFLAEITIDHESLKRNCTANHTETFGKFQKIGQTQPSETETNPLLPEPGVQQLCQPAAAFLTGSQTGAWGLPTPEPATETAPNPSIPYGIHLEDANKTIQRSAKKFEPGSLSGNREKLLIAWDTTLKFFLEEIHRWKGQDILYLPGFGFGNFRGLHKTESDGNQEGNILYINPLAGDGTIGVSCHQYETLYAIGAHECTHILERYHDEDYANALTLLIERTTGKTDILKSRIRKALQESGKKKGNHEIGLA